MFNQGIIEFWPTDLLTQVFESDIHAFEQVAEGESERARGGTERESISGRGRESVCVGKGAEVVLCMTGLSGSSLLIGFVRKRNTLSHAEAVHLR